MCRATLVSNDKNAAAVSSALWQASSLGYPDGAGFGGPADEVAGPKASNAAGHGRQVCPTDHLQECQLQERERRRFLSGVSLYMWGFNPDSSMSAKDSSGGNVTLHSSAACTSAALQLHQIKSCLNETL